MKNNIGMSNNIWEDVQIIRNDTISMDTHYKSMQTNVFQHEPWIKSIPPPIPQLLFLLFSF